MNCHIERDPIKQQVLIYLWVDFDGKKRVYQLHEHGMQWTDVEYGMEMPISFRMGINEFEALAVAAMELPVGGPQTVEALHDARQVRDRLLTLVENLAVK